MIGAVLLGANLVTIAASAIAATIFSGLYGDYGPLISTVVLTPLLLIFGEVMPKTYAITAADKIARVVAWPVEWMVRLLSPIVSAVQWIVNGTLRLLGVRVEAGVDVLRAARAEILGAVELHAEEGGVETDVRDRLRGALDLSDLTVADVMIHRKSIKMLDIDLPPREIIAQAMASSHTRLPLYKDEPENIVGVLHARDLLRAVSEHGRDGFDVAEIKREPWFTPVTTSAEDQLAEFLRRREHFALVVDEYGALMGLVTLEDILEEIVGDIKDEHDIAVQGVRPQPDGSVNVDGTVPIRDLNRAMNWDLAGRRSRHRRRPRHPRSPSHPRTGPTLRVPRLSLPSPAPPTQPDHRAARGAGADGRGDGVTPPSSRSSDLSAEARRAQA